MDWYSGSGIEDLVVPKDGELPDRLPSPDSWFKWGMNAPPNLGSGNKYFTMDSNLPRGELNSNGKRSSCHDDEMGASVKSSSVGGELSHSLQQSAVSHGQADYQLDDFPGIEQMDDIFLSSLLEDLPAIESFHKSVSISPTFQSDTNPNESAMTHMVDSQSNLSDMSSIGNSNYARTDDICGPVSWEDGGVTRSKSEQLDHALPLVKALQVEHFPLSEENSTSGYGGEETSMEESILQELEIVMTQLTEKTRLCFRDALYRLAKNSKQQLVDESQTGDPLINEPHPWTTHDATISGEAKKPVVESETNTIDRAIANLMYGEMESNARNVSLAVPTNLKQEFFSAPGHHNYCSTQQDYITPRDAEVPIRGHMELTACTSSM